MKAHMALKYSALLREPAAVLSELCTFLDIDSSVFDNFKFQKVNPTYSPKSKMLHSIVRKHITGKISNSTVRQVLRGLYLKINTKNQPKRIINSSTLNSLKQYYRAEYQEYGDLWPT